MKQIRKRLTYANVMSSIAVFLVIGGGAAFAATQLAKNSVGSKQLKKNAVTTAKIKKAAVTKAKVKDAAIDATKLADGAVTNGKLADGSVSTGKLADGAVTGAKINAGSTPFSQVVSRVRGNSSVAVTGAPSPYPFGNATYTQAAGESNSYIGAVDFSFPASCTAPRSAVAYLSLDSPTPGVLAPEYLVGLGSINDSAGGTITKRAEVGPFPGLAAPTRFAPSAATQRTFSLLVFGSCTAGSGITATFAAVDVIGTR